MLSNTQWLFLVVVCSAVAFSVIHAQDFGFPEETGYSKDRENANVSGWIISH